MSAPALEVRLVVLDWAGTAIDHGCFAPVAPFVEAFGKHGIRLTTAQARVPMGLAKRDHVRALFGSPETASQWRQMHDRDWTEDDVEAVYRDFIPLQTEAARHHSRLVPGLLACVELLRRRHIKIGTTTGYFRGAFEVVLNAARAQGYAADCDLCAEDAPAGRPAPWMIFRIMETLGIYPPSTVVKVGDTVPDIEEGLNAGAWSVGVTRTGSEVGCTEEEFDALSQDAKAEKLAAARQFLLDAGAHAVIDSIADLPFLIDDLNRRLRRNARPG